MKSSRRGLSAPTLGASARTRLAGWRPTTDGHYRPTSAELAKFLGRTTPRLCSCWNFEYVVYRMCCPGRAGPDTISGFMACIANAPPFDVLCGLRQVLGHVWRHDGTVLNRVRNRVGFRVRTATSAQRSHAGEYGVISRRHATSFSLFGLIDHKHPAPRGCDDSVRTIRSPQFGVQPCQMGLDGFA